MEGIEVSARNFKKIKNEIIKYREKMFKAVNIITV